MRKIFILITTLYIYQNSFCQFLFDNRNYTLIFESNPTSGSISDCEYFELQLNIFHNKFILTKVSGKGCNDFIMYLFLFNGSIKKNINELILYDSLYKLKLTLKINNDSTLTFIKGLNIFNNISLIEWHKDIDNSNLRYDILNRRNDSFIIEYNAINEYNANIRYQPEHIKSLPQGIKYKINYNCKNFVIDTGIYKFKRLKNNKEDYWDEITNTFQYKIILNKKKYLLLENRFDNINDTLNSISYGKWYIKGNILILKDNKNDYELKFLLYKKHLIPLDYWYYIYHYSIEKLYSKEDIFYNGYYKVDENVNGKSNN